MPTPLARYKRDLNREDFVSDPAQCHAVEHIQRLYDELVKARSASVGRLSKLKQKFIPRKPQLVRGLYLWGGVGRGKTYLMDNFYDCLPFKKKFRLHFHRFMQQVHHELRQLKELQNPLDIVAQRFAKRTYVICLDEFHVSDITDAMLLGNVFKALFDQQVTLMTTSNVPPDDLYKGGLQRDRFLPAIALLKQHTVVVNVDSGVDYRLRALEKAEIYHCPLDEAAHISLNNSFMHLSPDEGEENVVLEINGRRVQTIRCGDGVVWFDFQTLCNIPRAVADYIELAQCFNTVLLSNIHCMSDAEDDKALRLINLVDEFYDRNVKLIISAQAPPEQLYTGKKQAFAFQRTISRLEEMRSHEYLERPHLP